MLSNTVYKLKSFTLFHERERHRERERERERERDRERQRETDRQTDRQRQIEEHRERETGREERDLMGKRVTERYMELQSITLCFLITKKK